MFTLFVYLFVTVFVLVLVSDSGDSRSRIDRLYREACEDDGSWLAEVQELDVQEPEDPDLAWFLTFNPNELSRETNLSEMSSSQVRALCKLYDIPVSKRGKVNRATMERLRQVA